MARVLLMTLVLASCSGLALAQDKPGEATDAKVVVEIPKARASARATMQTFLVETVAAADGETARLANAIACLDLSGLPPAGRAGAGQELAIKLKEIIDRVRFVRYEEIPDARDGSLWVFYREPSSGRAISIGKTSEGDWRFTRETVGDIEALYRALETEDKVAGVAGSATSLSASLWLRSLMPDSLKGVGFLMEHWQWLALVILIVVGVLIGKLIRFFLYGPVDRFLKRRAWRIPGELIMRALRPTGLIATSLLWMFGLRWVGLSPGLNGFFVVIVKFLVAYGFVVFLYRIIDVIAHRMGERAEASEGRFDDLLVPLFRKSAKVVVTAVGVVFIADVVGVQPTSLLAGLGLGGLAVALAAQDTVKNFFGSLTVLLDRPFEVGDAVIIGGNTEGIIEEVGFRSTRIRTYENSLITLPNSNLISAKVDNLGKRNWRRLKTLVNITYDTPPDKISAFCEGLRELVEKHPLTRKDAAVIYLDGLSASSIDILFITHFVTTEFSVAAKVKHDLLLDIIVLASRLGVSFAYPTQTLYVHQGPELVESDEPLPLLSGELLARAQQLGKAEAERILSRDDKASPAD